MTASPSCQLTPEQWALLSDIFGEALDLPPDDREAFVQRAARGDQSLAREVLRLLPLHDSAGNFLETPVFRLCEDHEPLLESGVRIADRFRIVSLRGRGGMGEVYEASDEALNEPVALKVMRTGLADPETVAARIRSEVQLARRVSHPAVCRVHDVTFDRSPERGDLVVLTMELLSGETLAARMARGPIGPAEAFAIAEQIGAALDAAHALRIVHGDVKPENVQLVPCVGGGPRVVLTDFGLARMLDSERGDGEPGMRFGTPAYMAPELLEGRVATASSDLYALALVMIDMVAGRLARQAGLLPALRTLPARWRGALRQALDADPARRFYSAADFLSRVSSRPIDRARLAARRLNTRWGRAAAAATLLTLALLLNGLRIYLRDRPTLRPASELLVVDTVNDSGNSLFDGSGELLRGQLAQSPHFTVLSADRIQGTLLQMRRRPGEPLTRPIAREIALRQGAALVLYSAITHAGGAYALTLDLERVGPRPSFARAHWAREFTAATASDLFTAAHDAAVWARQMTGESAADLSDQDRPPSETTTSSWEALRLFAKANQLQSQGRSADAVLILEQALAFDPDFATAQMRRADILIGMGRDLEGYAAWREAIRLGERRQVTSREYLRIRAQYFEDAGEWAEAEKAYRTYAVHYPNDADAAFLLGSVLRALGRDAEAVGYLEHAVQLRPAWFVGLVHLGLAYLDLGRSDAAAETNAALIRIGEAEYAVWLESLAFTARGDSETALRVMEPLRSTARVEWVSRAFALRASALAELDRRPEAIGELLDGVAFDAARDRHQAEADKWLALAELYRMAGDGTACEHAATRAIELAANMSRVTQAGIALALAGRPAAAAPLLRYFDSQPAVARVRAARDRLDSAIQFAYGRIDQAVVLAKRSSAAEAQGVSRLFVARALARAGDAAGAAAAIDADVRRPARLYRNPDATWPGAWKETRDVYRVVTAAR